MKTSKFPLERTGTFSTIFLDYLHQNEKTLPFYSLYPNIENFKLQIEQRKSFEFSKRVFLREAINTQYSGIEKSEKFIENLKTLGSNKTFTITTGHQLNLCTGPLYFIYKIVTVINLCKKLKSTYPEFDFIPIYWMASEDHDVEEINHFTLFNKKYVWETDQKGPVGRFQLHGIEKILEALPEKSFTLERAYLHHKNLADATRFFVNELLGQEGLIVIDPDHPLLKKDMKKAFKEELFHQRSNEAVEETNAALEKQGYKRQANVREINLFYLENNLRERFVKEGERFHILNTDKYFDDNGIIELIERHPEKISPNTIFRPLYQEMILPNLAYVGGPAEVAYWLQLKKMFDMYKVPFPIVIPRNFALIINKSNVKKLRKINLDPADLFLDLPRLKEKYLRDNGHNKHVLDAELDKVKQIFNDIRRKAEELDKSLSGFIGAEENKVEKIITNIEKRLKKAEESSQEITMRQLESLKEKLFPQGGLQERTENFLNYYFNDPGFIESLLQSLDPLDFRMNILMED
jgi:bacillithiol synthase